MPPEATPKQRPARGNLVASLHGKPSLSQPRQCPFVFCHELVNNITLLELHRKNLPCVGLHLEMTAQLRLASQFIQDADNVILGRAKQLGGRTMQRDMKMNPPLRKMRLTGAMVLGQGHVQIPEPRQAQLW